MINVFAAYIDKMEVQIRLIELVNLIVSWTVAKQSRSYSEQPLNIVTFVSFSIRSSSSNIIKSKWNRNHHFFPKCPCSWVLLHSF